MKQAKKLVLSKETLAVLTNEQVGMVGGGGLVSRDGNCASLPCNTDACTIAAVCGPTYEGCGATGGCGGGSGGGGSGAGCIKQN